MVRSIAEKAVCRECGVDVRENTYFCYNCGSSLDLLNGTLGEAEVADPEIASTGKPDIGLEPRPVAEVNTEGKAALERLAEQISIDREGDDADAVSRAAARRRKARSAKMLGARYVWEPVEEPPGTLLFLIVGLVVFFAILAVVATVIWK